MTDKFVDSIWDFAAIWKFNLLLHTADWLSTVSQLHVPMLLVSFVRRIGAALCVPRRSMNDSSEPVKGNSNSNYNFVTLCIIIVIKFLLVQFVPIETSFSWLTLNSQVCRRCVELEIQVHFVSFVKVESRRIQFDEAINFMNWTRKYTKVIKNEMKFTAW